mmetsp:Transcript_3291/g.7006  ORF Transcript_3291/g.7006 Transcript_3291/m.7006 type:complete len:148 (+) Transcript_3291:684-1127(+)
MRRNENVIEKATDAHHDALLVTLRHRPHQDLFHERSEDQTLKNDLMMRAPVTGGEDAVADFERGAVGTDDEADVDNDFVGVAFFDLGLNGGEGGLGEEGGWDADRVGEEGEDEHGLEVVVVVVFVVVDLIDDGSNACFVAWMKCSFS